jgi:hypothetical protein
MSVRSKDINHWRQKSLAEANRRKGDIHLLLDEGNRDWSLLRNFVEEYIEAQTAADVLSGQTKVEN